MAKAKKSKPRKVPDAVAKEKWLSDHGPYELCMMRYCLGRLLSAQDQLDYNAHFECFASKARVLVDFLDNRGKQGNDIRAVDFTSAYSPPSTELVKHIIKKLSPHVTHASTERPNSDDDKITRNDCCELACWIETAAERWLKALDETNRALWADDQAGSRTVRVATDETTFGASSEPMFSAPLSE